MGNRRLMSFIYAFRGIGSAIRGEPNMRIHLLAAAIAIVMGFLAGIDMFSWVVIVICIVLVFAAELINSSIEAFTDLLAPEYHKKAEKAKDMAAGAVLVVSIGALVAGIMIFLPYIPDLL